LPLFLLSLITGLIVIALTPSCRKIQDVQEHPQDDLTKNFFNIPEGVSDALRSVIADIKKQDDKYHFVIQLTNKYGLPAWNKSISNTSVRNTNARNATGDSLQLFLIPFRAKNSSVNAYLACARNGDEFTYRFYKKEYLSCLYAANDTIKQLREGLLSVFGFFEKRINNKDSVYIGGVYKKKVEGVSISFNGIPVTGRVNVNTSITLLKVCYTLDNTLHPFRTQSTNSEEICITIGVYGSMLDLGFTSSGGYSSGGDGTGGGGSTSGNSFPDGFQCPQSEWWCESGDYRRIDGVYYTPYSYPGQNAGLPWLWWESQVNANEPNPNLADSDPDVYWWNDQTTTYPPQTLPSWANAYANYPKDASGGDMPAPQVYALVGGEPLALYNSNTSAFANACALRVSRALLYSGIIIPNISGHTFKGADNKYYFLSSAKLYNWMKKTFGEGDIVLNQTQGGQNGINFQSYLSGNKGIYLMQVNYPAQFEALGHSTLFDGTTCIGNHCYFNAEGGVHKITLWKLN